MEAFVTNEESMFYSGPMLLRITISWSSDPITGLELVGLPSTYTGVIGKQDLPLNKNLSF
jgi:hypothetical protein